MDPTLVAERILAALTTHTPTDKEDLVSDLVTLAEWLSYDGFIPFITPTP